MLGVKEFKKGFFDTKAIVRAMDQAQRKALSKMGAFVRRRAKSSLKYKDKSAVAGSPPFVHQSGRFTRTSKKKGIEVRKAASPLRELIYFAYDTSTRSVVVGPAIWPSARAKGVPGTLEKGGSGTTLDRGIKRSIHISPHPFMGPALEAEAPNFRETLRGMIN